MLNNNLQNLFILRQIQKPRTWMIKQGISPHIADRLLQNEQRHIKFDDVERLCLGLNCSPADLFVWQPDSEADNIPGHPLQAIRSDRLLPDVMSKLKFASLDELQLMDDFLAKVRGEKGNP